MPLPLGMKKFRFLLAALLLACLVACAGAPSLISHPEPIPLTVLFFNDLHGHLTPFEIKGENGVEEVGGIARMATLIRQIRDESSHKQARTLVLVAGDILQGTPMSTVFKGEPDIRCLNAMGVDAMTVGNHEFDFGLNNFLTLKEQASFPFLSANIIYKDSGRLLCQPALEVSLDGNVTLTIIGVTTQELLTTTRADNVASLDVRDSVAAVSSIHAAAAQRGPVLLLSHSRQETDRRIAKALPDLTAVIGGHDAQTFVRYDPPIFNVRQSLLNAVHKTDLFHKNVKINRRNQDGRRLAVLGGSVFNVDFLQGKDIHETLVSH